VTTISYELTYSVGLLLVIIHSLSTGFGIQPDICVIVWLYLVVVLLVFRVLQECNRSPFDSVESESELVAGYSTELSVIVFMVFILSEYFLLYTLLLAAIYCVVCYFVSLLFLCVRLIVVCSYRAIVVRIRYDRAIQMN